MPVHAVILAAGQSSRLGSPKQMVRYQGQTLVHRTAQTALTSKCARVSVVLGCNAELIRPALEHLPLHVLHNAAWTEGIASSIRTAVAETSEEALLLLPCDLPHLTSVHLNLLVEAHKVGASLVSSAWDNAVGIPALFTRAYFPELMQLTGDTGARRLLKTHADQVHTIPFPAGAFDIDTPEDAARLN